MRGKGVRKAVPPSKEQLAAIKDFNETVKALQADRQRNDPNHICDKYRCKKPHAKV